MDHVAPSCATQGTAKVLDNVQIARDTFLIRLESPELADDIRPGQFVMIRPASGTDPLLGRPFALYNLTPSPTGQALTVDLVYQVVGKGTLALSAARPGDRLRFWGPLGNGFGPPPDGSVVFVAGGIGQTPFLALGRWWTGLQALGGIRFANSGSALSPRAPGTVVKTPAATAATLLYGVRSADYLAGLDDFRQSGITVEIATDDGSAGHHGYVTDLLEQRLVRGERPAKVVGCGPPAMLATLSRLVRRFDVPCDLSLENHMACGFGVCFSCVAPIRQSDGSADLRRVCVEGPIFNARDVVWA